MPPARLVVNGGEEASSPRCGRSKKPAFGQEGLQHRSTPLGSQPEGAGPFSPLKTAPPALLLELKRQRSPKKDSTAITTTTTPMIQKILFISCLPSFQTWSRLTNTSVTPRRIIGQTPPNVLIAPDITVLAVRLAH